MIKKRNGSIVDYDGAKIVLAVKKAMSITKEYSDTAANEIESTVSDFVKKENRDFSIDEIETMVEDELMRNGYVKTARSYMTYRIKRQESRLNGDPDHKYRLLTKEFLSKYKHISSPMTEIGSFVFYRTYSRWMPQEKRREYWWETVARAVDYNCSIDPTMTIKEAENLFDNIFNLRQFLSGRTLWSGGSETAYSNPISQYNCSGIVIDNFDCYKDITYLLMLGVGVGFNVQRKHVQYLPKVRGDIQVSHLDYDPVPKKRRKEVTEFNITGDVLEIIVGDSKVGWAGAVDLLLRTYYSIDFAGVNNIMINYNSVRPAGEPLKKFGGTASGHGALETILKKIHIIVTKNNNGLKKLRPIDAMDIANIIAEGIVVGGVRRSAEMCFFDADDDEIMNAKSNLYTQDENGVWVVDKTILHRMMSNNSIAYEKKPTKEDLIKRMDIIRKTAEGNFFNLEAARKRKANCEISNPCGEILLDSHQFCNLTTINMMSFVVDGELDWKKLIEAQKLSARAGYRIAMLELELPNWDKMQKRDRLIGCSVTGWQDMVNATGLNTDQEIRLSKELRSAAQQAAYEYADSLGLNRSELVTTVKPEGTISQLPTVSSGLHFSHSPYYVRRVRISAADPLVKVCEELGYPIFPEVGQEIETAKTKVIEFPVKAPEGRTKYTVSAIEQLEIYKMFMENYVDHNASNTISVRDEEWEDVTNWVYDNWDSIIGITFISLENSFYQLLPYEACTKEQYEERASKMKPFNPELLQKYETREDSELDESECSTGACPIR